jgi:hypothetical protein
MRKNNRKINKNYKNKNRGKLVRYKEIFETKHTDNFATPFTLTSVPVVHNVGNIAQGTGFDQRIGIWIRVRDFEVRLDLFAGTALVGVREGHMRFVVVRDLQQRSAVAPTVTDVINPFSPLGVRNVYYLKRFQIMKDILVRFSTYDPVKRLTMRVPVGDSMGFAGGAVTDQSYRGIYILMVSDNNVNSPTIGITTRINFWDA